VGNVEIVRGWALKDQQASKRSFGGGDLPGEPYTIYALRRYRYHRWATGARGEGRLALNLEALIVFRFLAGMGASAQLSVLGGVFARYLE